MNPDFFQLIAREGGKGLEPVGYGFRAVEELVGAARHVAGAGSLEERRVLLAEMDKDGLHATPANSYYNELVVEAGRLSLLNDARRVAIRYGDAPGIELSS